MPKFIALLIILLFTSTAQAGIFETKFLKTLYGTWQEYKEPVYKPIFGTRDANGNIQVEEIEQKKNTITFTKSTINENNLPPVNVEYEDNGEGLITIFYKSDPIIYVRILSEDKLNYALVNHPQAVVQFDKVSSNQDISNTSTAKQTTFQYKGKIGTVFFHDFGNKKQIEIYSNAPDGSWTCEFHGTSNDSGEQLEFTSDEDANVIVTVLTLDGKIQVLNNCDCCGLGGTISDTYELAK